MTFYNIRYKIITVTVIDFGEIMKYSKQRELILEYLKSTKDHPTAEMVYLALKDENPLLSLGTVYRNLSLLCETGLAKRVVSEGKPDRFDGRVPEHYHAVCSGCERVFDIEMPYYKSIDERAGYTQGFSVGRHEIMFFGLCSECEAKKQ